MPLEGQYEPGTLDWAREQAELYEASGGLAGTTYEGKPVVMITSVGAKTGALRKNPVMKVEHDGEYAAVASKGGSPEQPSWYYNFRANPLVQVQDGTDVADYTAREVTGEERALWWERAITAWPPIVDYQKRTERTIPVFVLTKVAQG